MLLNQANLTEFFKNLRVQYLEAYHAAPPVWSQLAQRVPSAAKEEVYAWLGAISGLRELIGEIEITNLAAHRYSIINKEWERTIEVPQFDLETDSYGTYSGQAAAFGAAARQHPDELVADLLINGFTKHGYTGKPFFAANHEPQKGGTKFSNVGTKKLSTANFEIARQNLKSRLNAKGRPMGLGVKLLLVVSPKNESLARQILIADTVPNAAGTASQSNVNKGTADILVWPQLATAEDAWFLLEVGQPVKPLIFQVNKEPEMASLTSMASDHVFKNHKFLYQIYARYNAGYGLPELAYGSDGSQAA